MRVRIIIDTEDAEDAAAIETGTPFTLNVYRDDDDGAMSREPLTLGTESALIGGDIAAMLGELSTLWQAGNVLDQNDDPMPRHYSSGDGA